MLTNLHSIAARFWLGPTLRNVTCLLSNTRMDGDLFRGTSDRFSGITVDTTNMNLQQVEFEKRLKDSLDHWIKTAIRGVWFKIPLAQAIYVPLLAKEGFEYHHTKKDYVMMTKWLAKDEPVLIPPYPHTSIGVAGLVVNNRNEILVIKEKYHTTKHWKFPGGYANPGEDFADTARREVLEETGIDTVFHSVVAFRHHHKHSFECSDIYVVCLMIPKNEAITSCNNEIAECRWMKLEEFKSHREVIGLNRMCVEALEESQRQGLSLGYSEYFSKITNEFQKVYYLRKDEK